MRLLFLLVSVNDIKDHVVVLVHGSSGMVGLGSRCESPKT